ncbi:hypothetical protein Rhopal_006161-T1 [Rhodotorula paludigena]|uniref:Uncharacterized protein n=1 Tax=Rhodotorula paludigena TaxID=86838 RepID=A0AAV5GUB9_9BASI|nr:hypothetical protein Rhopal_006161-T1 [Rhodotorula paludigena]
MPAAASSSRKQRLEYQPLTGQGAATSTTSELVKRLKHAHDQLRDFDQDLVDVRSLDALAKHLCSPQLLLHKDKSVKAYTACCLVDVLRLYAPEAPYTPAQLADLFDFLVRQLRYVGNPSDPHQHEYFFVVDSLASVKSIVIVCDLDAADDLVERVFRESFDTISTSSPKNVELALLDILLALLEELEHVPTPVLDVVTAQFLPRAVKQRPAAFRLAVEVCRGASDKLQRYVSQYFGETIVAAMNGGPSARKGGRGGAASSDDDDDSDLDDENEDDDDDSDASGAGRKRRVRKAKSKAKGKLKANGAASGKHGGAAAGGDDELPSSFVQAHDLIRSLHRHVPSLLLNVIPQLSEELTTSSPAYRRLATTVLGSMFGEPVGHGDLARAFPAVWREWCSRAKDRETKVRVAMCEAMRRIWREHPELADDLAAILISYLLKDSDEKVRIAACAVFEDIDYETALHHVPKRVLEALGVRMTDKKEKVRAIACKALGRLYDLAYPEIESREELAQKQFGWIPGELLESLSFADASGATPPSQIHLINGTLLTYLVPLPKSDKEASEPDAAATWTDRFLLVEQGLSSENQRQALMALTRLSNKTGGGSMWEGYLGACEKYNSGIIDDKTQAPLIKEFLKKAIKAISGNMPDPAKASEDLMTFADQNVAQLYRELRVLLDPQTDLRAYLKNSRDLLRRVEKFPHGESVVATFEGFLRLASYALVNRSSIPQLLKRLTAGAAAGATAEAGEWAESAARVLEYVSKHRPALYKSHAAELAKLVADSQPGGETGVAGLVLHALARLKRAEPGVAVDAKLSKKALAYAQEGDETEAKQAATLLAHDKARPGTVDDLVEHIASAVPNASDAALVPHFAALARVARHAQDAFERKSEQLTEVALEILVRPSSAGELALYQEDESASWTDAVDPLTEARVLSIKILTNRALAFAKSDSAQQAAQPVFDLLWPLLSAYGVDSETSTPPVASRIRLGAALSLLKLLASNDPTYLKTILGKLDLLARMAQDTTFEVREGFLRKLVPLLRHTRIHPQAIPRFNMILFLVAHEPEVELKELVLSLPRSRRRMPEKERQQNWEQPFVRLLHLLAHHPDFETADSSDIEVLRSIAKYIVDYLEIFATAENCSYLFHLALSLKTVRDRQSKDSENVYILSELSQHLLKQLAARHSWPISTYPGSAQLPADLYVKFATPDEARKVAQKSYIQEAVLKEIGPASKPEKKKVVSRKRASATTNGAAAAPKPKRARTSAPRAGAKGKGKKKADKWDSESNDENDDEEDESSASEEDDDEEGDEPKKTKAGATAKGKKPTARGQRGGLRSDPSKKLDKGLGESEDEDARSATAEQEEEDGNEMDVDEEPPAKAKSTPKKNVAPKGKKAAAPSPARKSPAAAKGRKGAKADEKENSGLARRAARGLKQPRALQKANTERVSDVGESDDEEEAAMSD